MLIGISGKARSGKDTFSIYLAEEFEKQEHINFVAMAFADALKYDLKRMFNLSIDQLYGNAKEDHIKTLPKPDSGFWTSRELMQVYGTDWVRSVEPLHWVRRLFDIIDEETHKHVIITDVRQQNEFDAILERNGFIIRIIRNKSIHVREHSTESELDYLDANVDTKVNFYISNAGSLRDLREAARGVVSSIVAMTPYLSGADLKIK